MAYIEMERTKKIKNKKNIKKTQREREMKKEKERRIHIAATQPQQLAAEERLSRLDRTLQEK